MVKCPSCGREFDSERSVRIHEGMVDCEDSDYTDAEKLRSMYWDRGLSLRKIADKLDVTLDKIVYQFEANNIETREGYAEQSHASLTTDKSGYELWKTYIDGEYPRVRVHRLLAIAEYGFDAVCGKEIHHKNNIQWDNRPENIEPMTTTEHRKHHAEKRVDEQRELMNGLRERGVLQ